MYRVEGHSEPCVYLSDLVTNQRCSAICESGYRGNAGDLWFTRVLPTALTGQSEHVVFTSPYVLMSPDATGWAIPRSNGSERFLSASHRGPRAVPRMADVAPILAGVSIRGVLQSPAGRHLSERIAGRTRKSASFPGVSTPRGWTLMRTRWIRRFSRCCHWVATQSIRPKRASTGKSWAGSRLEFSVPFSPKPQSQLFAVRARTRAEAQKLSQYYVGEIYLTNESIFFESQDA